MAKDAGAEESRAKANHMIRRMKEFGWLDYEQRENFKIFILLPHYSSRLWGLFANLCEGRAVEYQRFAFTTYQVLSGEAAKAQPSMAVLEAERLAEEFVEELRILLNNIKSKMEQVSAQTSLQDVLSHHFVEYRADIVDRSYHRLKTSDHVSRYRIRILQEVQEIRQNKERLRALCDDAVRRQLADSVEAAEYRMNASLQTIEEIYRGLDDMFAQIDRRHNQYVRASYERALYLQQAGSARTESMIAGVLLAIAEAREEGSEVGGLSRLFRLQAMDMLLPASRYVPRKKRILEPAAATPVRSVDEELRQRVRRESAERVARGISRQKIEAWILEVLGQRGSMEIEELLTILRETAEPDLLQLLYVYLYGHDELARYQLGRHKEIREQDTIRYSNRTLRRREKRR
ncbi:Wadjet anti-phage system protein JetA family protein [Selenomonas sp. oral taxon 138]|uniref:Wadjet anti-phage system protein JetA family protein n=1 Tax=Selenomonas sp. oral taxon 138 TaxID=712532 RepID=UPI0002A3FBAC|nr:Wadjet anti-phage system protein JetA family protein [Selenomonas sp. oral taxon 138]EKX98479.1 hypothetical protein HMPREF9163_01004 [Selenomonas sp. oral taxon 138 str. F0429]